MLALSLSPFLFPLLQSVESDASRLTLLQWYPTEAGTAYPHHSLSCNVIDSAQMIVMGGTFPNSTACDVTANYGMHNMDFGKQNPSNSKWALFRPNITTYKVPSEIVAAIGGR